jgi:serine/threonine protein kinase
MEEIIEFEKNIKKINLKLEKIDLNSIEIIETISVNYFYFYIKGKTKIKLKKPDGKFYFGFVLIKNIKKNFDGKDLEEIKKKEDDIIIEDLKFFKIEILTTLKFLGKKNIIQLLGYTISENNKKFKISVIYEFINGIFLNDFLEVKKNKKKIKKKKKKLKK